MNNSQHCILGFNSARNLIKLELEEVKYYMWQSVIKFQKGIYNDIQTYKSSFWMIKLLSINTFT